MQHEIEEAALKKETDKLSQEHLAEIQKELADMRDKFAAMKARWDNEKQAITKVQRLREEIEQVNAQIEKAENEYNLDKLAELKYGRLPELQKELEKEEAIADEGRGASLLRDKVTEEEIARIISRWTGIPVAKLMEGEREKLLHLGRYIASARYRAGRSRAARMRRHSSLARGHSGSGPADWFLPVYGTHWAWVKQSWPKLSRGPV